MKLTKQGVKQLQTVSAAVNEAHKDVPNNCYLVAQLKKKILGRGKIRSIKIPARFNETKCHIYLEVDGYILDSGLMKKILLD